MKDYSTPIAEKIEFSFEDQVVASGTELHIGQYWAKYKGGPCVSQDYVAGSVASGG